MRKIYTGIDLGSFSIKIVVSEVVNNKFHVLAASNTRCKGIKNGIITNFEEASTYLMKAKKNVESMLGISLDQAIVTVPSFNRKFDIVEGKITIDSEDASVSSIDINFVLQVDVFGKLEDSRELV